jgi:predicted ArsR family transcriptional regulator
LAEHSDLPDVVTRDVDVYIDNLDGLEVAMLLYREQARSWTADQVATRLRISTRVSRRELERMCARGIASLGNAFRFDGSDPDRAAAVARIAATYGTRRVELINYVASQTLKRIQSIADAFRIKKDDHDE